MSNLLKYAQGIAFSTKETLQFTYDCAVKLKNIDGCFVECGVAAGAQIIAMAEGAPDKIIHAFDSFEGIPLPSNRDDQMPGIRYLNEAEIQALPEPGKQELKTSGATSFSVQQFRNNVSRVKNPNNIVVHQGWFENTVPQSDVGAISLLRLDGDLYNSTMVCLKKLFPLVVNGGIVIIDDWQLSGCRAACLDYFHSIKYVPKYQFVSNIAYFER